VNRFKARSLRAKMYVSLALFVVIFGGAVALLLLIGFQRSQDNATNRSREGLEEQSRETLTMITEVQTLVGQLELQATGELSAVVSRFLVTTPASAETNLADRLAESGGVVYDPRPDRMSETWFAGSLPLSGQALRDLQLSESLSPLFQTLLAEQSTVSPNFEAVAIYYVGPSELVRYYPLRTQQERPSDRIQHVKDIAFVEAAPLRNPGRGTVWTAPYRDPLGRGLIVTAANPVYIDNQFRGVVGVDLSLQRLIAQLDGVQVGDTGFAFYIDSLGQLLPNKGSATIASAIGQDADGTGISPVIAEMRAGARGSERLRLNGRDAFISFEPLVGPGGSIGLVAWVDEMTEAADNVATAIENEGNRTMLSALITLALLFVGTSAFAAYMNRRWLIQPIESLVEGTRAVAAGDLTTTIPVRTNDELGALAHSFNRMTGELALSRQELEERQAQFRGIFEATSDGVIINDPQTGVVVEANPAACRMHGYTREEFIGLEPTAFVHPDYLPVFADYLRTLRAGEDFRATAMDLRKDGTSFHVEVVGSTLEFSGKTHLFAVVRDITERVQAYELLEERVSERTRELSTLLRVSQSVGSTLDLDALLAQIVDQLHEVIDYNGSSLVIEEDGVLRLVLSRAEGPGVDTEAVQQSVGLAFRTEAAPAVWEPLSRGETVIIDDVLGDSELARNYRGVTRGAPEGTFSHVRAWMAVPLVSRGRTIGFLSASRTEPGSLTQRHGALAIAFANQASAAFENAKLFAQAQRRVRENAALARIASLFTLTEPLQVTLDTVAASVADSAGAMAASVILNDDDGLPVAAGQAALPIGFVETAMAAIRGGAPLADIFPAEQGTTNLVPEGRRLLVDDPGWDLMRPFATVAQWESFAVTPLFYRGRAIGSLVTYYATPAELPAEVDQRFLQGLADQVAIGAANANLFVEASRRAEENQALAAIASRFTLGGDLEEMLDAVSDIALQSTGAVAASVAVLDHGHTTVFGCAGLPDGFGDALDRVLSQGTESEFAQAALGGEPMVLPYVRSTALGRPDWAPMHALIADATWEGMVALPLRYRGGTLGVLALYYEPEQLPARPELGFAQAVADQVATGVANADLFAQTKQRARENKALAEIAARFTLEAPVEATLDGVAATMVEATNAVAATIIIAEDARPVAWGSANQPEGYMETILDNVAPHNSVLLAAAATGSTIRIPDVRDRMEQIDEYATTRSMLHLVEWQGITATPLMYRGKVIGAMGTYYRENEMPGEQELAFLQAMADQAAIGIENANLFAEATRRTHELEALYRADEELHRSLHLDTVLQAIADAAVELLGADTANVAIWDEQAERPRVRLAGATPRTTAQELEREVAGRDRSELAQLVFRVVEDVQREPPGIRERAERLGVAAYVEVPVVVQGHTVGLFGAAFERPRPFSTEDQRLFQALAQRAALAIDNANLFAQTERRRRQLDALYRADEALHRSLRLEEVVQSLNDVAVDVLQADRSLFASWPEDAPAPITWSASGISDEMFEELSESFRQNSTPEGFRFREPFLIEDIDQVSGVARARMELAQIRAVVQLPIVTGENVFGVFFLGYEEKQKFSADDRRLFQALAQRAAVAIENAQLYEQAQNLAAVEERQRLARELHDSVSQALYGIALGARTARTLLDRDPARATEPMDYVLSLAEAGLAEMRALIFELRPESLANEGIVRAIEKHVASTQARYGVKVHAELANEPEVPLPVKEALYRIMQEALHNTVKHARAKNVYISLRELPQAVELELRDDGTGFDTSGEFPGQLGLKSMRERALRLGGQLEIESSPESGTRVCARIPK